MAICSIRTRVESVSAKTPPPAFTTNVLPLYMRMYGAALFSARIARLWSALCMIIALAFLNSLQQFVEHRHLNDQTVVRLLLDHTARAVEYFVGHRRVAPYR